jgi:hypothetical protein
VTVIDVVPSETTARIAAQARTWTPRMVLLSVLRGLLSLVAWVLLGAGKVAYWVFAGVWLALTWSAAAVKVGWADARAAHRSDVST